MTHGEAFGDPPPPILTPADLQRIRDAPLGAGVTVLCNAFDAVQICDELDRLDIEDVTVSSSGAQPRGLTSIFVDGVDDRP